MSLLQARIFINRTIGELLFDGYEDEVMKMAESFENVVNEVEDDFEFEFDNEEEDATNQEQTQEGGKVPMDKFGWFYKVSVTFTQSLEMLPKYSFVTSAMVLVGLMVT